MCKNLSLANQLVLNYLFEGVGLRDFPECVLSMLDLEYLWLSNTRTAPKLNPRSDVDLSMNMVWQIPTHLASLTALTHFEVRKFRYLINIIAGSRGLNFPIKLNFLSNTSNFSLASAMTLPPRTEFFFLKFGLCNKSIKGKCF